MCFRFPTTFYEDLFVFYSINKFFKPRYGSSYYNELLENSWIPYIYF